MRDRIAILGIATTLVASLPIHGQSGLRDFRFREPEAKVYRITSTAAGLNRGTPSLVAVDSDGQPAVFGTRIILQLATNQTLKTVRFPVPGVVAWQLNEHLVVLEMSDPWAALLGAEALAKEAAVRIACPDRYVSLRRQGGWSAMPRDPYFLQQWNLENRRADGFILGPDLNPRAAWSVASGIDQIIGISDGGIDLAHPDLAGADEPGLHFNFDLGVSNGLPVLPDDAHATQIAGLSTARANNLRGIAGIAPQARFASWVILTANGTFVSESRLAEMFTYRIHRVPIQNHSWNYSENRQARPGAIVQTALDLALDTGRYGRGVLMIRPAGNYRANGINANDDGYLNDPRILTVAGLQTNGQVSAFSVPGACVLLAAPAENLVATDLSGPAGENRHQPSGPDDDAGDYCAGTNAISGTSFSCAQISGLVALVLSVNTNLAIRDVQQILLLSARQRGGNDPTLQTNGAGLIVSHNTGFGLPDAGLAVRLARDWKNRPALTVLSQVVTNPTAIPDATGLAALSFFMTNTLLCEHVGIRLKTDHPVRGQLAITLISPAGTASILQQTNSDTRPGPSDWTYYSVQHFLESSYGTWRLEVRDAVAGQTGGIDYAELILRGIAIQDANHNGLEDAWESHRLATTAGDPLADPDLDGWNNAQEQVLGSDPLVPNEPLALSLSLFRPGRWRLGWPASPQQEYQVLQGDTLRLPANGLFQTGSFPEGEVFFSPTNGLQFFQLLARPCR